MSKQLFIAASSEENTYATALKDSLSNHIAQNGWDIKCVLWDDYGMARVNASILDNLSQWAKSSRYAVALLTPDDVAHIHGNEYSVARDNVLFEFGLFLGQLGSERVFAVTPKVVTPPFRTPTDLKGIITAKYEYMLGADIKRAKESLLGAVIQIIDWLRPDNTPITPSTFGPAPTRTPQWYS